MAGAMVRAGGRCPFTPWSSPRCCSALRARWSLEKRARVQQDRGGARRGRHGQHAHGPCPALRPTRAEWHAAGGARAGAAELE
eukprot:6070722-Lingulodinium_polyedra.AAC.1